MGRKTQSLERILAAPHLDGPAQRRGLLKRRSLSIYGRPRICKASFHAALRLGQKYFFLKRLPNGAQLWIDFWGVDWKDAERCGCGDEPYRRFDDTTGNGPISVPLIPLMFRP